MVNLNISIKCDRWKLRLRITDEITALNKLSVRSLESLAPVQLDQQSVGRISRMDAIQQQSMSVAYEDRLQYRHLALVAAGKRFDEDDYGYCLNCCDEIVIGRLMIGPAVTFCIRCA